ncbi:MAG: N-acetylmuramoyl-L-alanine amidase, partial [Nanoarchaeota archaeon]|nr:N-acetylmuramoyl-L-alanine amidase [Nanoarchaeota archaeon]
FIYYSAINTPETQQEYIGENQLLMIQTISKVESALLFIDRSAYIAFDRTIIDLADLGGSSSEEEESAKCGIYYQYYNWLAIEDGILKKCYPESPPTPFSNMMQSELSKILDIYPRGELRNFDTDYNLIVTSKQVKAITTDKLEFNIAVEEIETIEQPVTPPTTPGGLPRTAGPMTIVIDPGHGAADSGTQGGGYPYLQPYEENKQKIATSFSAEANKNMYISDILADKLRSQGHTVYLTHFGEQWDCESCKTGRQARTVWAAGKKADIFISIHNNAAGSGERMKTQRMILLPLDSNCQAAGASELCAESKELADSVGDALLTATGIQYKITPWGYRGSQTSALGVYTTTALKAAKQSNMKTILLEMAAINDPALNDQVKLEAMANALVEGINNYAGPGGMSVGLTTSGAELDCHYCKEGKESVKALFGEEAYNECKNNGKECCTAKCPSDTVVLANLPTYMNQHRDFEDLGRCGEGSRGVSGSGCGPVSLSMAFAEVGKDVSVKSLFCAGEENEVYTPGKGTTIEEMERITKKILPNSKKYEVFDFTKITNEIKSGNPVVLDIKQKESGEDEDQEWQNFRTRQNNLNERCYETKGHWVNVVGVSENHIIVNDPATGATSCNRDRTVGEKQVWSKEFVNDIAYYGIALVPEAGAQRPGAGASASRDYYINDGKITKEDFMSKASGESLKWCAASSSNQIFKYNDIQVKCPPEKRTVTYDGEQEGLIPSDGINEKLIDLLNKAQDKFGVTIIIESGTRPYKHNLWSWARLEADKAEKLEQENSFSFSSPDRVSLNSWHMCGSAADFRVKEWTSSADISKYKEMATWLESTYSKGYYHAYATGEGRDPDNYYESPYIHADPFGTGDCSGRNVNYVKIEAPAVTTITTPSTNGNEGEISSRTNILDVDVSNEELVPIPKYKGRDLCEPGVDCRLKKSAAEAVLKLAEEFEKEGCELVINSAQRSEAAYKTLYEQYKSRGGVCKPRGGSFAHCPHARGVAIDIRWRKCMPYEKRIKAACKAGWANWQSEGWHFEYGSNSWKEALSSGYCQWPDVSTGAIGGGATVGHKAITTADAGLSIGPQAPPANYGTSKECRQYGPNEQLPFKTSQPCISVGLIKEILENEGSPVAGSAQAFYDYGVKYGIDPAIALAFFRKESNFGKAVGCNNPSISKNPGNIKISPDRCTETYFNNDPAVCHSDTIEDLQKRPFCKFSSWEQGIEAWYKVILAEPYIAAGRTTVESVFPTYAPSTTYAKNVKDWVNEWRKIQIERYGGTPTGPGGTGDNVIPSNKKILDQALLMENVAYNWGGRYGYAFGPTDYKMNYGIDCIGLQYITLRQLGVISASSEDKKIFEWGKTVVEKISGKRISDQEIRDSNFGVLMPGDLVFVKNQGHTGIYFGEKDGKHMFLNARGTGPSTKSGCSDNCCKPDSSYKVTLTPMEDYLNKGKMEALRVDPQLVETRPYASDIPADTPTSFVCEGTHSIPDYGRYGGTTTETEYTPEGNEIIHVISSIGKYQANPSFTLDTDYDFGVYDMIRQQVTGYGTAKGLIDMVGECEKSGKKIEECVAESVKAVNERSEMKDEGLTMFNGPCDPKENLWSDFVEDFGDCVETDQCCCYCPITLNQAEQSDFDKKVNIKIEAGGGTNIILDEPDIKKSYKFDTTANSKIPGTTTSSTSTSNSGALRPLTETDFASKPSGGTILWCAPYIGNTGSNNKGSYGILTKSDINRYCPKDQRSVSYNGDQDGLIPRYSNNINIDPQLIKKLNEVQSRIGKQII